MLGVSPSGGNPALQGVNDWIVLADAGGCKEGYEMTVEAPSWGTSMVPCLMMISHMSGAAEKPKIILFWNHRPFPPE